MSYECYECGGCERFCCKSVDWLVARFWTRPKFRFIRAWMSTPWERAKRERKHLNDVKMAMEETARLEKVGWEETK